MHLHNIHFLRCINAVGCVKKRHAARCIHKMQAILSVLSVEQHFRCTLPRAKSEEALSSTVFWACTLTLWSSFWFFIFCAYGIMNVTFSIDMSYLVEICNSQDYRFKQIKLRNKIITKSILQILNFWTTSSVAYNIC